MSDETIDVGDWARSYRRRQGNVTKAQRRALRELAPDYLLDASHGVVIRPEEAFGRRAHTTLEIGFGMGENLVAAAAAHPERDFVGVEVHVPGIGAAMKALDELGVRNARVVRRDAIELLARHLPDACLDEVWIFFPEPWPRPKDVGRRIVRAELLDMLARRMRPGATLRVATDVAAYAQHALDVLDAHPRFENLSTRADGLVDRPPVRAMTKYESKGIDEGRRSHDLHFALSPPDDAT